MATWLAGTRLRTGGLAALAVLGLVTGTPGVAEAQPASGRAGPVTGRPGPATGPATGWAGPGAGPASGRAGPVTGRLTGARPGAIGLGELPVTVVPPPGARVDPAGTDAAAAQVTLRLDRVTVRLRAEPSDSLAAALATQRTALSTTPGFLGFTGEGDAVTDQGVPGRAGAFEDTRGPGSYAVFQGRGVAVLVDVRAERGALGPVAKSVAASLRSLTIGDP